MIKSKVGMKTKETFAKMDGIGIDILSDDVTDVKISLYSKRK